MEQLFFAGKAYLKINSLVKTPLHEFMAVERSGLWAPVNSYKLRLGAPTPKHPRLRLVMGRGKPGGGIGVGANRCKSELSLLQGGREGVTTWSPLSFLTKRGIRTARDFCRMPSGHCTLNEFYI